MKTLTFACSLLFVLIAFASKSSAQNWAPGTAKIADISVEVQQTPQFQAGNVKDKKIPRPRDWVEVEVEFELSDRVVKEDFVPAVMVRYYIALRGEKASYMMTGDVTHVNVPTGEDIFSCVYLPPAVIDVAQGKDSKVNASDVLAVGIAIFVNGVEIAREAKGQPSGWWLTPGSLVSQAGILPKGKTPFALLWIDRHADEQKNG
jgi:hypothetical protein